MPPRPSKAESFTKWKVPHHVVIRPGQKRSGAWKRKPVGYSGMDKNSSLHGSLQVRSVL